MLLFLNSSILNWFFKPLSTLSHGDGNVIFLLSLSFLLLISSRTIIIFRTTADSLVHDNDIEPNDDSDEEIHIQV